MKSILDIHFPQPFFGDIQGTEMRKTNVFDFYACGQAFERLKTLKIGIPIFGSSESVNIIADAQKYLRNVTDDQDTTVVRFKSCVEEAKKLLDFMDSLIMRAGQLGGISSLTDADHLQIYRGLYHFEILFKQECAELGIFTVSKKGILSTAVLIEHAEEVFSNEEVGQIVALTPQAIYDIKRAGQCIAFELPTAAGFHSFRALESVILGYMNRLDVPPPANRNMGEYIRALEDKGVDKKIVSTLRQLKDNFRNPLFHPSENLEPSEDIDVFNLSKSAISAILKDMASKGIL